MRKFLIFTVLILGLFNAAYACGAPQPIYGQTTAVSIVPVGNARVYLWVPGLAEPVAVAVTGPFGYYSFDDLSPCNDYLVTADHKRFSFSPLYRLVLAHEFKGDGVRVDFNNSPVTLRAKSL